MHSQSNIRYGLPLLLSALAVALFAGCSSDPAVTPSGSGSSAASLGGTGSGGAGDQQTTAGEAPMGGEAGEAPVEPGTCRPVKGEPLQQRSSILSNTVIPTEREVFLEEIWTLFSSQCKGCHIDQQQGGFNVSHDNFVARLQDPKVLPRLTSEELTFVMPPTPPKPYSTRPDGDQVKELVKLLTEWGAAGHPNAYFVQKLTSTNEIPYALSTETGTAFSNIGTCVPEVNSGFASDTKTMAALDAAFAARKAKPDASQPEDQIGLPQDLADTDFTSFDSEVLARRGLIAFAPTYPLWSDDAGKLRYVRVPLGKSIVFNPKTQHFDIPDNTRFYKTFMKEVIDAKGEKRWRKMETRLIVARKEALATSDANYVPQSLFGTYKWDESETHATLLRDALRNGQPFADEVVSYVWDEPKEAAIRASNPPNLTYTLEQKQVLRHWAIPGSKRCIHCHQGSSNGDFILGFTPLQINRRPLGEGGVYEQPAADELTQLQRLIDLGVITGLKSGSEVVKLEDSQRARKGPQGGPTVPRNDLELRAQGYLLGNCAHCHNPNGFPSVANPELIGLLNFYPSAEGGVFQFPLERYSPRITRGFDNSQIAYITPSLRDLMPNSTDFPDYPIKYGRLDTDSGKPRPFIDAPWRSLIYRNTQTPFTYGEALTLYPHMPFDSAGHDCRAGQWLGEWMVSIPAVRKDLETFEDQTDPRYQDMNPQPYAEVLPGEGGYNEALKAANVRLASYRNNPHYAECPDNSDIFYVDSTLTTADNTVLTPRDTNNDGVPDHANWVSTDLTEFPGLWQPRRVDWKKYLTVDPSDIPSAGSDAKTLVMATLVEQLQSARLSDVAAFANTPFPMGLWQQKPGCNFSAPPADTMSSDKFKGAARPAWFDEIPAQPDAPVYSALPGQVLFDMICINCHGPNADSLGRQADTLQNLTGGAARVANFRFGLFNPTPQNDPYDKPDLGPQLNRERVFGPVAQGDLTADDWGARYLAWMALGGTGVHIPDVILQQVARTNVLGATRSKTLEPADGASANMLQVAQVACSKVLGWGRPYILSSPRHINRAFSELIPTNGDAELWTTLCSLHNTPPVTVVSFFGASSLAGDPKVLQAFYPISDYPADAPVGDQYGQVVTGIQPNNTMPWCLDRFLPDTVSLADLQALAAEKNLPLCPVSWSRVEDLDARQRWINRGAINAGLSVFTYLNKFIKGELSHVTYDQCENRQ